jgi:hypothetical protein
MQVVRAVQFDGDQEAEVGGGEVETEAESTPRSRAPKTRLPPIHNAAV